MKLHKYSDSAFSIYGFMPKVECLKLIEKSEKQGFEAAKINDGLSQSSSPSVRNNSRIIFDDQDLAAEMWGRLKGFIPMNLGIETYPTNH